MARYQQKKLQTKFFYLILLFILFSSNSAFSQNEISIANNSSDIRGICMGKEFRVNFTADGKYLVNNEFFLELSDKEGSWVNPIKLFPTLKKDGELVSQALTLNSILPLKLSPGNKYQVRVVSSNTKTISKNSAKIKFLSVDIIVNDSSCDNDGSIILSAFDGATPLKYYINDQLLDNSQMVQGLSPNKYIVKVIDGAGCEFLDTVEIKKNSILKITSEPEIVNPACGFSNGKIIITAEGMNQLFFGIKKYGTPGEPVFKPGSNRFEFTEIGVEKYICFIKDQAGCKDSVIVDVTKCTTSIFDEYPQIDTEFKVYPNPANEKVMIESKLPIFNECVVLEIFNISGKRVLLRNMCDGLEGKQFGIQDWSQGIYLFHLNYNGRIYTQKVLVY